MSMDHTSATRRLLASIASGDVPAISGWQLTLKQGVQGWPADVRDLVSLGGDVVAAGNHWIIVTEDLRDDILFTARDILDEPQPVTIVMLDDLPASMTADVNAMDELQTTGWMTATGDAFVFPLAQSN
jgi:hypothetical protein